MAKKAKAARYGAVAENIETYPLDRYTEEAMILYGSTSIEDRALPDFRDGFKPVQRRVLYSIYKLGLTSKSAPKKSSRIVGDTLGKFHPHGDSSVYSTMVNMVNSPKPTIFGDGNWGSLTDGAAAHRYTNAKLSKYGEKIFFNSDYMKVTKMYPNYDGTLEEPVVLPSLLPNVLVNGTFGIAVATTSHIPPFKIKGLSVLIQMLLQGKSVDEKDCMKHLKFNYQYGGHPNIKEKELRVEMRRFFKTGEGSVYFEPEYTYDEKSRKLRITGFPTRVDVVKALAKIVEHPAVSHAEDATDKFTTREQFEVFFKRKASEEDIEDVLSFFCQKHTYKVNVTVRKYNPDKEETRAKFKSVGIPKLLEKWVKWRVALEKRVLNLQLKQIKTEISYSELMVLAVDNRKVILASLEAKNSAEFLMKKLKITEEQANTILDLRIRSLRSMDKTKLVDKLEQQKKTESEILHYLKKPNKKVSKDLTKLVGSLEKSE